MPSSACTLSNTASITLLFYRVWRPRGDASMFVMPLLAGLAVGTLEEWLQWFIPGRVGDMRDVFLNAAAIVCGLLFSYGVDPPDREAFALRQGSLRRIGFLATVVGLLFAAFVYSVHIGVEIQAIRTPEIPVTIRRLDTVADRPGSSAPGRIVRRIERPRSRSREDQYMSEGLLHAQERNRRWEAGEIRAAWSENLILEKYYAPVLDAPSYISKAGHRWPAGQRTDAGQRLAPAPAAVQGWS